MSNARTAREVLEQQVSDTMLTLCRMVASDIMESGKLFDKKPGRIQFMVGQYPYEKPAGGLCEEALAVSIHRSLVKHLL